MQFLLHAAIEVKYVKSNTEFQLNIAMHHKKKLHSFKNQN